MPLIQHRSRPPRRTLRAPRPARAGARTGSRPPWAGLSAVLGLVVALTACGADEQVAPAPSASVVGPSGMPEWALPAPAVSPTVAASPPAGAETPPRLPGATTVSGAASTVSGTLDEATLAAYARMADRAVAQVSARWGRPWSRRVTIVAPADLTTFREQVGRADDVSQVAAVTDGPVGPDGRASADRIVLNPVAFASLTEAGKQVVITHESVHVAVRESLPGAAPLWLVEGYADHVGYAGAGRRTTELAQALLTRVAEGNGPTRLPAQADFDPSATQIAPTYLASWLAVDLIARRHGEQALHRFYVASTVDGSPAQADTAMDAAFADVLGTTRADFTRLWLAELSRLAAPK